MSSVLHLSAVTTLFYLGIVVFADVHVNVFRSILSGLVRRFWKHAIRLYVVVYLVCVVLYTVLIVGFSN